MILSAAALASLVSKSFREVLSKLFGKYGKTDEVSKELADMKNLCESNKKMLEEIQANNAISVEFEKMMCRTIIKDTFYKYKDARALPLYEKKTLVYVKDLYVNKRHGNSYASLLLDIMDDWDVDCETTQPESEE